MSRPADTTLVRGGDRRPARARRLLAGGLLCALAVASFAPPARTEPRPGPLCGVVRPIDPLLGCGDSREPEPSSADAAAPPPPAQPAPPQSEAAAGTSAALTVVPPQAVPATPRFVPDLLLLQFLGGVSARRQAAVLAHAGATPVGRIDELGVVVAHVDPAHRNAALAQLRASSVVAEASKDAVLTQLDTTPNDTDWSTQWGLRQIALPSAWDRTHGGNVVVAVIDTGVAADQPDLRGAVLPGYNLVAPATAPADDNGHGTAVAGIIAARTDNHTGIAGVCWTCSILPIKVLGADGTGDTATVAAGIVKAADAGARVINLSLGGPVDDPTLDAAVAYATGKGAVLVAAAGNNGTASPFYPAANAGVIGVAATDESGRLYPWSNFGSWVHAVAPGCDSAPAASGDYVVFCGTSAATPVVAGLAALAISLMPNASANDVVAAIERSGTSVGTTVGGGLVDAAAALAALQPSPQTTAIITVRSALGAPGIARVYRRSVPAGVITATLTFAGPRPLTLAVRNDAGATVATVSGTSPLHLSRLLPAGLLDFAVSGRRGRAAFHLSVVGQAPPPTSTSQATPQ